MKETVKLIDDSEIEIECRPLFPRKAFSLVRSLMNITHMKPISVEVEENGKRVIKESQEMYGEFSGIIELIPLAFDQIVVNCPQKDQISVESMNYLYKKYAEKTVQQVMTSVSPNLK